MDYDYQVIESRMLTATTLAVTVYRDPAKGGFHYKPGQYAAISFRNHGRPTPARCFSMTSSPTEPGYLQFAMRIKGDFTTTAAKRIRPGAVIRLEGPFGSFVMRPFRDRMCVMLAGGIGITPFMSMARFAAAARMPNDLLLLYSCRSADDIPFAMELMELQRRNPRFHVIFAISDGPIDRLQSYGWQVVSGRVTDILLDSVLSGWYRDRTYFMCGPPPFMEALDQTLRSRGVPKRRIITEVFSQSVPQTGVLLGRPSQVYALTALSLIVGTGMVINHDVGLTKASDSSTDGSVAIEKTDEAAGSNSRQNEVDQIIGDLQGDDGEEVLEPGDGQVPAEPVPPAMPGQVVPAPTPGSRPSPVPAPAPVGRPTPSPGTAPTPSPSPSPSPAPAPSPGPAPTPTPAPSPAPAPSPSPTPAPPPAPAPVVPALTLTASQTSINRGSSVTLSWRITNAATQPVSCTASGGWSGSKAMSGSQSVAPAATTTYSLRCANAAGAATRLVTVTVIQPAPPPPPPPPSSGGS